MTRFVLLVLSTHMGMDGSDAFPAQVTLAAESGLSLRCVKDHLAKAEQSGWIARAPRRIGAKESFRFGTAYLPRFPLPPNVVQEVHQSTGGHGASGAPLLSDDGARGSVDGADGSTNGAPRAY